MTNHLLTVKEVSLILRVNPSTIWRWCKTGKLPAFQIGHSWRIRSSDLENLVGHQLPGLEQANANSHRQI